MLGRTDPAFAARDNYSGFFYNSINGGSVRYPNLRYGNPTELAYYAMCEPLPVLARRLRRDERTVRDWISGRTRVPWWVPEILRLKRFEADIRHRQMGMGPLVVKLGLATGDVIALPVKTLSADRLVPELDTHAASEKLDLGLEVMHDDGRSLAAPHRA